MFLLATSSCLLIDHVGHECIINNIIVSKSPSGVISLRYLLSASQLHAHMLVPMFVSLLHLESPKGKDDLILQNTTNPPTV